MLSETIKKRDLKTHTIIIDRFSKSVGKRRKKIDIWKALYNMLFIRIKMTKLIQATYTRKNIMISTYYSWYLLFSSFTISVDPVMLISIGLYKKSLKIDSTTVL